MSFMALRGPAPPAPGYTGLTHDVCRRCGVVHVVFWISGTMAAQANLAVAAARRGASELVAECDAALAGGELSFTRPQGEA